MNVIASAEYLSPAQALTYNKMAPMALGRIDIKYRRIACQVPQALDVIVDENRGAGGWIRLQVKVCFSFLMASEEHAYDPFLHSAWRIGGNPA